MSIPSGGGTLAIAKATDARQVMDAVLADVQGLQQGLWGQWGNLLVNPDMAIGQRGGGPFVADNGYNADRWKQNHYGGSSASVDVFRGTTGGNPVGLWLPARDYLGVAYTHAGSGHATVGQKPETWWSYKGLQVSLSGGVWANTAGMARLFLYDGLTTTVSAFHAGSSAWQRLELTATVSPSATELSAGLYLQSASGQAYFTGARLALGSQALDFAPRPMPVEFNLCQRYYELHTSLAAGGDWPYFSGYAGAGGQYLIWSMPWKTLKAVTSPIPHISAGGWTMLNTVETAPQLQSMNDQGYALYVTAAAAGLVTVHSTYASGAGSIAGEANPA